MYQLIRLLEYGVFQFWDMLRRIVGLVMPFFSSAREYRALGQGLRYVIHVGLLILIVVGLWFLNEYLQLSKALIGPPVLRPFWLSIIFLLIYALAWLGWWLWKLLGPEQDLAEFPDIDQAWDEALRALYAAGIDLTEAPLFLVLGKPHGGEDAMFNAAQLSLAVKGAPNRADAPLRVFANRDAIFVTSAGCSLLGRQSAILAGEADGPSAGAPTNIVPENSDEDDKFKTLQPKGKLKDVQAVLARAREMGRDPENLTDAEKMEIRQLLAEEKAEDKARKPRPHLLRNKAEVDWLSARLRYLCRIILRDRQPYCPVNGVMVLLSYNGTDTEEDASQTGAICQHDLAAVRRTLQVNCPVFTMFCDVEAAVGFPEFIERFPNDQKARRLGLRFPLVPDLPEGETTQDLIERGSEWIAGSLLPTWVYKLFKLETPGRDDVWKVVRGNGRLYQFLGQMRERQGRFKRLLTRAMTPEKGEPLLYGGCYLAATGRDVLREQAFVAGVFRRLLEEQNYVSWTDAALAQEARYDLFTRVGYGAIAVAALGLIALAYLYRPK